MDTDCQMKTAAIATIHPRPPSHAAKREAASFPRSRISWSTPIGWCLLRLSAKVLALLRVSVNFFQLRLKRVKNQFPLF